MDLFRRLRYITSANWGMGRNAARTIYAAVFLPRVSYASEIWAKACGMKKSTALLDSIQRAPLLAMTSCYRTASTNCLAVIAGVLPLDLEIRKIALKTKLRANKISYIEYKSEVDELLEIWQNRYEAIDKGEWTKKMIPSVKERYELPMCLDHYTVQTLSGHGDFLAKLYSFKLVNNTNCKCTIGGAETVAHVLLKCERTKIQREALKHALSEEGEAWPPRNGAFLRSKKTYEALRTFASKCLRDRKDR